MPVFEIKDQSIEVTHDQVEKAFEKTSESDWKERPGTDPYHFVIVGGEEKPVKAVFRNLENYREDFSFTTHDAERVFKALDFQIKIEDQQTREKDREDPNLFLAPCSNSDAYDHLVDTVLQRVPVRDIEDLAGRKFDQDVISIWGNREGTRGHWEKIEAGDFLLFYRDKNYIYAAEITGTEINEELSDELWPDDEGDPWKYIIYLKEPFRIDLSQDEINELADYADNYVLRGFQKLNDNGHRAIRVQYGSVIAFLQEKLVGPTTKETEFLGYGTESTPIEAHESAEPAYSTEIDVGKSLEVSLDEDLFSGLYFPDEIENNLLTQIESALNSNKNIIFTGPPGTGKTEIARRLAENLERTEFFTGHQITTATSDWSTFDTVGGYMPEQNGEDLEFNAGQVLRRFKSSDNRQLNELLVIDEINRADIDKAFGQLFTVLSGQGVQLPYQDETGREIEILPADKKPEEPHTSQYIVPDSWKILATMNSYDKTSLYEMSYAFMRRFAFIRVDVPSADNPEEMKEHVKGCLEYWAPEPSEDTVQAVAEVWFHTNNAVEGREIGPSIVRDMLGSIEYGSENLASDLTNAVASYLLPQLEGVRKRQAIVQEILDNTRVERERLEQLAEDMLQVNFDEEE